MVAKIITVAQQKGGAGKTTMTAHLAACWAQGSKRVAVVDIDPQGSLGSWYKVREATLGPDETGMHYTAISGWRVRTELDRLRQQYDIILIDSPPHADAEARTAIRAADLVVIPLQPSPMDVWATGATIQICKQERVPVKMVLNRVNPQAKITNAISGDMIGLTANRFGNRVAFAGSLMQGLGVTEYQPSSRAAEEVRGLAREVMRYLNKAVKQTKKSA